MAKKDSEKNANADGSGKASFEELLEEAEALSRKMEDGGLSLEESIAAYEKGVANLKRCAELLRRAEEKVKVLIEQDGAFKLDDFGANDEEMFNEETDEA